MSKSIFAALFFSVVFFNSPDLTAEPWMATRFAQNCAGCHAPSRYNLPPKDRRCTLSCQGCHVNPNGGGLRSFYGKWNSDRWMRSFNWKVHGKEKEKPLPWFAQGYIKDSDTQAIVAALMKVDGDILRVNKKPISPAKLHRFVVPKSKKERKALIKAINATEKFRDKKGKFTNTESDFPGANFAEFYFERPNGDINWDINATSWKMYESTIPYNDPYKLKKREAILAGLDFRYMGRQPIDSENKSKFWPMALDVGLQMKPFIKRVDNFSVVVESRYFNSPNNDDLDYVTTGGVTNRSTYLMIDDMFYNSFIMYGMYKPMFEHFTPDHTTLAQSILYDNRAFRVVNKALSLGLAPNVPFANFHFIQPMLNDDFSQEEGFIANLGARWVTLGASLVYSYRNVKDTRTINNFTGLERQAHSLSGGMMYKNFILNAEALNITKEYAPGLVNGGTVTTFEVRYKIWRETYLESMFEFSNILVGTQGTSAEIQQMNPGDATQVTVGFRFFPVAGVDLSVHYRKTTETPKDENIKAFNESEGLIQAHLYF